MNRYFLYIAVAALLTAACNRQQEEEDPVIPVTGITLNPCDTVLLVGATLTLDAAVEPAEATNQTVTWNTSDDRIATVNSAGELTAVALGTVTITATTDDGEFTATCTVTVAVEVIPVTGITHNLPATLELLVGAMLTLEAAVEPAEATSQTVTWSTSDPNVVTITPAGELTAIAPGTATITAVTDDGAFTATCTVTVTATGVITMTTLASEVSLRIAIPLKTDLLIDWGDGAESTINEADMSELTHYGLILLDFSHSYLGMSAHNIIITCNILELWCGNNQLTTLDVSKNTALTYLDCPYNELTTLDVSKNTELSGLYCVGNQIENLDVSGTTALTSLFCSFNQLTALEVSNNTELVRLFCSKNQIKKLDVSNNVKLVTINCTDNQLTASALNDLFRTLPYTERYPNPNIERGNYLFMISIYGNPGESDCDFSIAEDKGWRQRVMLPRSIENPVKPYLKFLNQ